MKFYTKTLALIAIFFSILSTVVYVSCNKDPNPDTTTTKKCVTCANGGQCINDTCRCPVGYEGFSCETLERNKFTGSWRVTKNGVVNTYSSYIAAMSGTPLNQLYINYFDNTTEVYVTIARDSIFIPAQWDSYTYVIGKGYIHDDPTSATGNKAITIAYYIKDTMNHTERDYGYKNPSTTQPSEWRRF